MKSLMEDFKTGWYGIYIGLSESDIDQLIEYLQILKKDESYHFHFRATAFGDESGGVADIQFSQALENEKSNMQITA